MAGLGLSCDWYRNIQANPAIEVVVGRRRFEPVHRLLGEAEAMAATPPLHYQLSGLLLGGSRSRAGTGQALARPAAESADEGDQCGYEQ
ncbi:MAG: hypothetical protein DLM61_16790 [Pseudonocardiales bacterium]|nr:MAG: hypothetical protein DLM61_16790 [Pseudonocardiales bacterium]